MSLKLRTDDLVGLKDHHMGWDCVFHYIGESKEMFVQQYNKFDITILIDVYYCINICYKVI